MSTPFKTGDSVKHLPTGETWWVAWADDEYVYVGPRTKFAVKDCALAGECTFDWHVRGLRMVAESRDLVCGPKAKAKLEELGLAAAQ